MIHTLEERGKKDLLTMPICVDIEHVFVQMCYVWTWSQNICHTLHLARHGLSQPRPAGGCGVYLSLLHRPRFTA